MTTTATAVGKFVWHEQVSADPGQAKDFYTGLFGWDTEIFKAEGMDYAMINANGQNHGGFGKAQEGAPPPHWLGHVQVEDVDATVEKAKQSGGKLAAGPFDMGEVGKFAIIGDPQGAEVAHGELDRGGQEQRDDVALGDAEIEQRRREPVGRPIEPAV